MNVDLDFPLVQGLPAGLLVATWGFCHQTYMDFSVVNMRKLMCSSIENLVVLRPSGLERLEDFCSTWIKWGAMRSNIGLVGRSKINRSNPSSDPIPPIQSFHRFDPTDLIFPPIQSHQYNPSTNPVLPPIQSFFLPPPPFWIFTPGFGQWYRSDRLPLSPPLLLRPILVFVDSNPHKVRQQSSSSYWYVFVMRPEDDEKRQISNHV
ncbi:hypothetical protein PSHT_00686 [Puccinia striiformis]|uniref:Uncharacterized protein n=2 Tax=Puccinia striiformis TaxID=27350 RepID=A0A2S4WMB1_9BASI|nr:hypothetical protein PSTT_01728 [Puccinia striiformis]POW22889.1 hypothetical protein PSHT_00686 [Puccinia striiformis]